MKKFFKHFTKRNVYIGLFAILYSIVALVSLFHSFAFFGLANGSAMSIMLGVAFELGQAAVLFSILTSSKDRKRYMPWILMCVLTLVQILGNVFSSYKYMMTHSVADLPYFKEPVFIWFSGTLSNQMTTVIITYIVGGILPLVSLAMTSMIANYLSDTDKTLDEPVNEIDAAKHLTENNNKIISKDAESTPDDVNSSYTYNLITDKNKNARSDSNTYSYIYSKPVETTFEAVPENISIYKNKPKEETKQDETLEKLTEESPQENNSKYKFDKSKFLNL